MTFDGNFFSCCTTKFWILDFSPLLKRQILAWLSVLLLTVCRLKLACRLKLVWMKSLCLRSSLSRISICLELVFGWTGQEEVASLLWIMQCYKCRYEAHLQLGVPWCRISWKPRAQAATFHHCALGLVFTEEYICVWSVALQFGKGERHSHTGGILLHAKTIPSI